MLLDQQQDDYIRNVEGQRLMHSHLPLHYQPQQHLENRGKIVYTNRNPKDRHVSMYNFLLGKIGVPEDWTWSEYFEKHVLNGKFLNCYIKKI